MACAMCGILIKKVATHCVTAPRIWHNNPRYLTASAAQIRKRDPKRRFGVRNIAPVATYRLLPSWWLLARRDRLSMSSRFKSGHLHSDNTHLSKFYDGRSIEQQSRDRKPPAGVWEHWGHRPFTHSAGLGPGVDRRSVCSPPGGAG
eukprot:scaffold39039_cov38-Prasinocladus_malaysianus.AAC.4